MSVCVVEGEGVVERVCVCGEGGGSGGESVCVVEGEGVMSEGMGSLKGHGHNVFRILS